MSLGIDPIISNAIFSLNLLPHFSRVQKKYATLEYDDNEPPPVSIILALYKETAEDIGITIDSLINQSYSKGLYDIIIVLEPDDKTTEKNLQPWLERLRLADVSHKVVFSDGKVTSKPHALNIAVRGARGDYLAFYDASDRIDSDQVLDGIRSLTQKGADVAQARVIREGKSILSHFLMFDTILWYWKYLPFLLRFCGGFPLSGEGLFIKKDVLNEVNSFPEVLTEDALLSLELMEKKKRFVLLDSNVSEKAPRGANAHFKQKMRWHRGYLTCLRRLLLCKIPLRKKAVLFLPFSVPVSSAMALIGWLLIGIYFSVWKLREFHPIDFSPWNFVVYDKVICYWALLLLCVGIPFSMLSSIYAAVAAKKSSRFYLLLLSPFYWIFVGFCALCSFFRGTKDWGKTER